MMTPDDELIEKMWLAFRHAPNQNQMRAVLEVVRAHTAELERDAAIGAPARRKLVSGNTIPVERCTIKADEVAAIDAAMEAER